MSATREAMNRLRGEDRFYTPPAMRRQYRSKVAAVEPEDCLSTAPVSGSSNLDQFLEHTTPFVSAQYFSKTSTRGWRTCENEVHAYFILGDLWESFKEWSAYGAGVPLVLNESDSVVQYYVPYLSGIQLYIDPSRPNTSQKRPGGESDADSSREASSDSSSEYGTGTRGSKTPCALASNQSFSRLSLKNMGSNVDESERTNPPGLLLFEYLEQDTPYTREPLADKIAVLASQFPELKTYRSCDLTAASWISVAWYPIYRIPTGPTLQNLDACFLTFHSLSTPFKGINLDQPRVYYPLKLSLPTFGLASYKFKIPVWNSNGSQKANSLLQSADNWLRLLQVDLPDFRFFVSRSSFRR